MPPPGGSIRLVDDVTELNPGHRTLTIPEQVPETWYRTDPDWYEPGATVHVKIGGPDEGRTAGLVQAAAGTAHYIAANKNHPNYGRPVVDARNFPDGFRTFNRGPIEVTTETGTRMVQAGKIAIWGHHSGRAIDAQHITDGVEWLQREGKWDRFDDIALVGTASAVPDGPYAGAVMFRGQAVPGMTVRGALEVNSTTMSPELWEDPTYRQLVFAGAVKVDHTAWPYDVPETLAATADTPSELEVTHTATGPIVIRRPDNVAAAHEPGHPDPDGMVSRQSFDEHLEALDTRLDTIEAEVATNTIQLTASESTGVAETMQALEQQIARMSDQIQELENRLEASNAADTASEQNGPSGPLWKGVGTTV